MIPNLPDLFDAPRSRGSQAWMARCPAHDDRTPSLSIRRADDRWLLRCFAGCTTEDVLRAAGLDWSAVSPGTPRAPTSSPAATIRASAPRYAPKHEVQDLWRTCEPIDDPKGEAMYAAEWLYVERGIHPGFLAERDLARVITRACPNPAWARYGRSPWYATGHRLVVPMFDNRGRMRALRARGVLSHEKKELAPTGFTSRGLVFADEGGRHILVAGSAKSENRDADGRALVVVCEGATDYLTWAATRDPADTLCPAVLGIASGSWTENIAARIPSGARVLIDTDYDEAGERYAADVAHSIAARCDVRRTHPVARRSAA